MARKQCRRTICQRTIYKVDSGPDSVRTMIATTSSVFRQHPEATREQATEACRKERFKGGLHLAPKDLRDYFSTEIAAKSDDPNVAIRLMRHTSLATTTKYMRTVETRMRDAVESLGMSDNRSERPYRYAHGGDSGGDSMTAKGPEMSDLAKLEKMRELAKMLESYGFLKGKSGGGGQTRTVDSADMSRVL
jgi:hypothetical protein